MRFYDNQSIFPQIKTSERFSGKIRQWKYCYQRGDYDMIIIPLAQ